VTYRRRQGRRWNRRKKVSREEMVKFHQRAGELEAEKKAARMARRTMFAFWTVAIVGAVAAVAVALLA
jgi:hypothetical protein